MSFVDLHWILEQKVEVKDSGTFEEIWVWAASYSIELMLNSFSVVEVLQLDESIFVLGRYILTYLGSKCHVCSLLHNDEQ